MKSASIAVIMPTNQNAEFGPLMGLPKVLIRTAAAPLFSICLERATIKEITTTIPINSTAATTMALKIDWIAPKNEPVTAQPTHKAPIIQMRGVSFLRNMVTTTAIMKSRYNQ